ncbi:MAG TPA: pyridoxal-phosphate dependent enzyme [Dongiaceae bacterium]|jgi:threonine dehydratase|nr:pyridoxal-phosphate dependent enzyme [Dongiaceae bacterium]
MQQLSDIQAAAARLQPHIRRTPLLPLTNVREPVTEAALFLKLECLQVTGSFKARGATNRLLTTPAEALRNGIVTASGGNHGLATARAAAIAGVASHIFVPANVARAKLHALAGWGATVRIVGSVWDESAAAARAFAGDTGAAFFHPFADPAVVAGQGTVALEILEDLPDLSTLLVAIGGGGLISGIAIAIKALKPSVRLIGIEAEGSPTLLESLRAGEVVTLPQVTTQVATMACGRTDPAIFEIVRNSVEQIVLVGDQEMQEGAAWLWREAGLGVDLSGAAAVSALRSGKVTLRPGEVACALACGSGASGIPLAT